MAEILVDSNVILDVLTEDSTWFESSSARLAQLADDHLLVINPIIYAEVSIGFHLIEDLDAALPSDFFAARTFPGRRPFSPASGL